MLQSYTQLTKKLSKNLNNEIKFKVCRKEFKNLVKAKMRANLCDSNRNTLTKRFWSHVKSASKNTRFPETIYLKGRSTVVSHIYAYDRAKTLSFISLIRRKNTEFENESNV